MKVTITYINHLLLTANVLQSSVDANVLKVSAVLDARRMNRSLADTVSSVDLAVIAFTKALSETVVSADANIISFTKMLEEIVTSAESLSMDITKVLSDSAANSDAGLVRVTDYADITYFEEDYVGESRTF